MTFRSLINRIFPSGNPNLGNFFDGFVDFHSHILPGVDDGVESLDDSLAILAEYERMGFTEVWLTPHIMEDFPNTPDELRKKFGLLQDAYSGSVKLHLGAENMLDALYTERLAAGNLLPVGVKGDMMLVETSYYDAPSNIFELLEATFEAGYTPLLAHPERYNYMNVAYYRRLKDMNVKFQLNFMSLSPYYGMNVRSKALWLITEGFYDHIGTDIHRPSQLKLINKVASDRKSLNYLSYLKNNITGNRSAVAVVN